MIYHPNGALLRYILEDFEKKEHLKRGYQFVIGPQILKVDLWKKSGHYENYRENMYFTKVDDVEYGLKPMNCVAHIMVYKSQIRSYRDLPLRYFELGTVNRHELSGVLHGLMRVREFTQDDAHIFLQAGPAPRRDKRHRIVRRGRHGDLRVRVRAGDQHQAGGALHRPHRRLGQGGKHT